MSADDLFASHPDLIDLEADNTYSAGFLAVAAAIRAYEDAAANPDIPPIPRLIMIYMARGAELAVQALIDCLNDDGDELALLHGWLVTIAEDPTERVDTRKAREWEAAGYRTALNMITRLPIFEDLGLAKVTGGAR
ncbi:hypothetical protein [Frankia sp. CiP1_Cm_nod2]|uniref:hypothetical protein n=1 Tax=Frankia sp. CiP1_Cm_nod2 TaxID=2897161 RepID=UPI0020240B5A